MIGAWELPEVKIFGLGKHIRIGVLDEFTNRMIVQGGINTEEFNRYIPLTDEIIKMISEKVIEVDTP